VGVTVRPAVRTGIGRRPAVTAAAALLAVSVSWLGVSDSDDRLAALTAAGNDVTASVGAWPWVLVIASVAALLLAGVHYVLAGIAIRASSGRPLPLGEATLSQLASSVLNRIAPGGAGGAIVNTRYLSRRGLPVSAAFAAVGALGVLGGVADLVGTGLLLLGGRWVGLGGGTHELHLLATGGMRWAPGQHLVAIAVFAGVLGGSVAAGYQFVRWRRRVRGKQVGSLADAWRHLAALARRPRRTSTLLLASAGTTFVLALAFAIVVSAVAGVSAPPMAALVVIYVIAAATAAAVHIPAIAGPTELALTAALVASGVATGPALVSVLLFRGLTFWAPVPVGMVAIRLLRRRGAL
jgi:uncharacterized membrane protein YbhN (UPF0104 family)